MSSISSSAPGSSPEGFIVTEGWVHHFEGDDPNGTLVRWAYDPKSTHFAAEFTRSGHYENAEHGAAWEEMHSWQAEELLEALRNNQVVTAPYEDARFSPTWPDWATPLPTEDLSHTADEPAETPSPRRRRAP